MDSAPSVTHIFHNPDLYSSTHRSDLEIFKAWPMNWAGPGTRPPAPGLFNLCRGIEDTMGMCVNQRPVCSLVRYRPCGGVLMRFNSHVECLVYLDRVIITDHRKGGKSVTYPLGRGNVAPLIAQRVVLMMMSAAR